MIAQLGVAASNGVIHVIGAVLVPATQAAPQTRSDGTRPRRIARPGFSRLVDHRVLRRLTP